MGSTFSGRLFLHFLVEFFLFWKSSNTLDLVGKVEEWLLQDTGTNVLKE